MSDQTPEVAKRKDMSEGDEDGDSVPDGSEDDTDGDDEMHKPAVSHDEEVLDEGAPLCLVANKQPWKKKQGKKKGKKRKVM